MLQYPPSATNATCVQCKPCGSQSVVCTGAPSLIFFIYYFLLQTGAFGNMHSNLTYLQCSLAKVAWYLQGYVMQMPSARAALGLPFASLPLTAASQQDAAPSQAPQEQQILAKGPVMKGAPERASTARGGPKGMPSAQPQPVDMEKLLTVPAGVQELAAHSSDAHALLLKVG